MCQTSRCRRGAARIPRSSQISNLGTKNAHRLVMVEQERHLPPRRRSFQYAAALLPVVLLGCSSGTSETESPAISSASDSPPAGVNDDADQNGTNAAAGSSAETSSSGASSQGGTSTGGVTSQGGANTGGALSQGGANTSGATSSGGSTTSGGQAGNGGAAATLACGEETCAPNQYCRAGCSGTGGPPGPPRCVDVPPACIDTPTCECVCSVRYFCVPGSHEFQCGCG